MQCDDCRAVYPKNRLSRYECDSHWQAFFSDDAISKFASRFQKKIRVMSGDVVFREMKKLRLKVGENGLDIGTFLGFQLRYMEEIGLDAYGIESNAAPVSFAQEKGLKVFKGYFPDDIPEEIYGQLFSLITARESHYYFDDLKSGFMTIFNLLKPGGVFIMTSHQGLSNFYKSGTSLYQRFGDFVQTVSTRESLLYQLDAVGFESVVIKAYPEDYLKNYYGFSLPGPYVIQGVLNKLLPKVLFPVERADGFCVLARRPLKGAEMGGGSRGCI
ncbi:MAG: class I SAM-dependent methyltransferase [Thermodesulfobacteriota bacterium]